MMVTKLSANDETGNRISARKQALEQRIAQACAVVGRRSEEVALLAVSKMQTLESLQAAYRAGQRRFGENYLQEALAKIAAMPSDCEWHFIGPIQSNKTRAIAEHFDWVHSVSSERIARRLNDQRPATAAPLRICLQVNISAEASKSGIAPDSVAALAATVNSLPRLQIMGLMCIPQATSNPADQEFAFAALRSLRDRELPTAPCLSMGMSDDLEAAVAQGSTLLRIGTAFFGPRTNAAKPAPDR